MLLFQVRKQMKRTRQIESFYLPGFLACSLFVFEKNKNFCVLFLIYYLCKNNYCYNNSENYKNYHNAG